MDLKSPEKKYTQIDNFTVGGFKSYTYSTQQRLLIIMDADALTAVIAASSVTVLAAFFCGYACGMWVVNRVRTDSEGWV